MRDKKGVSEMVAYVLLIIIALTLATFFVYPWIKKVIFKPSGECEDNIALVIEDYSCSSTSKILHITIKNKGLFNVDGFFIRISKDDGLAAIPLEDINSDHPVVAGQALYPEFGPGDFYTWNLHYDNNITKIEIEPYVVKEKDLIICEKAVVNIETSQESGCRV